MRGPAENAKPLRNHTQSHSNDSGSLHRNSACLSSHTLIVFAAMAAPAPAKLTSVQYRHLGAKGNLINTFFKPLDASERAAAANKLSFGAPTPGSAP